MTFPQQTADAYVLAGSEFFRLNTLLSTAGDMYESTQSGHAFVIGPDSDISKVNINYYDELMPNGVNQALISPQRSLVGRIDAHNNDVYGPAGRPGRILIWPAEIFDSAWRPTSFTPPGDTIEFIQPRLDVIQYFEEYSSIVPQRSDKEYLFERLPIPTGNYNLVLPYYGRRYASIIFTNQESGATALTGSILGVNFSIDAAISLFQEIALGAINVAAGNRQAFQIKSTTSGMFDAIVLQLSYGAIASTGPLMIRITFSDTET